MSGGEGRVRVATLTASDTRTEESDAGGRLLRELLEASGFVLAQHAIVREDEASLAAAFDALLADPTIDAVVSTGGTGIAPRDRTIDVLAPRLERELEGFGEAFRRLSWDEVGPRSILSRALAGTARGKVLVALPGSLGAVRLGVTAILAPVLAHAVALASGAHRGGHVGS